MSNGGTKTSGRGSQLANRASEVGGALAKDALRFVLNGANELKAGMLTGSVVAVATAGWTFTGYQRYRSFLRSVAQQDGSSERDVAWKIALSVRHKWMRENLTRSMQALRDAIDEDARQCLVKLFAEYEERRALPDLAYKLAAEFFVASDSRILSSAMSVLNARPCGPTKPSSVFELHRDHTGELTWYAVTKTGEDRSDSEPHRRVPAPPAFDDVWALLLSCRAGRSVHTADGPMLQVDVENGRVVQLLHDCMRTALITPWRPDDV